MNSITPIVLLFDLDGTLLDTAPDFIWVLNQLLQRYNRPSLPATLIRNTVSQGTHAMLSLGFDLEHRSETHNQQLITEFLALYEANLVAHTQPFAGIQQVIQACVETEVPWGIVTNKPGYLTTALLQRLPFDPKPGCIVSGDCLPHKKPNPAPLLHACTLLGCRPEHAIYVGDAENDIIAGKTAGMKTLIAEYGYIAPETDLNQWQANGRIRQPLDLLNYINRIVQL